MILMKLFNATKMTLELYAATSYGDEYNTYLEKAVFTSCKKTDKCPPWKMTAKNVLMIKLKNRLSIKMLG